MAEPLSRRSPSSRATAAIQTQYLRIKPWVAAKRMWERLLTEEERQQLGGDLPAAYSQHRGTAGMWMQVRGVSLPRAVIEVAYGIGFLDEPTRDWLLREFGESAQPAATKPSWNAKIGELSFKGECVRRVRLMNPPTNVQSLLSAFEAAGWPRSVELPDAWDQQTAHETARSLNKNLRVIRFRVSQGGRTISWDLKSQ